MLPFLSVLHFIASWLVTLINTVLNYVIYRKQPPYPQISNKLLVKSVGELVLELRQRKLTSEELVKAYIERIKDVNPKLNAVVADRFVEALKEAQHADQLIAKAHTEPQLQALFQRYPLLGIPFTVKESCAVKGMSFVVGSIHRKHEKATEDGKAVGLLRSAGCIPLLVSANPEFCMAVETNTHTSGTCSNPFDMNRTPAGSSGGEGALNGAGATLFGIGSDVAGSIRLPALYCGVFGHKPTGGLVSIEGHFPTSTRDSDFPNYLVLGPITRFARDLPVLLQIMAGSNGSKLKFGDGIRTKDIKVYYSYGFDGLNGLMHPPVDFDIKLAITRAVKCFENGGLMTKQVKLKSFRHARNVSLVGIAQIKYTPSILTQSTISKPKRKVLIIEFIRALMGHSLYTKEALFMELMANIIGNGTTEEQLTEWRHQLEEIKTELLELLGNDGVLLFPTFHTAATHKHMSILNFVGIDMMALFNIIGFPATHIPLGTNRNGLPVGFQVIAAPYQDKLCLQIATTIEATFGGWTPARPHDFN